MLNYNSCTLAPNVTSQAAYSTLLGGWLIVIVAVKLTTVFSAGDEGTYLRRNILFAFGITEILLCVLLLTKIEGGLNAAGGSIKRLVALMILEGVVFVADAVLRKRPMKKKGGKKS